MLLFVCYLIGVGLLVITPFLVLHYERELYRATQALKMFFVNIYTKSIK